MREQKDLICLLFGIRTELESHRHYKLFNEFLHRLDAEYHANKGYYRSGC